jgi:hypothetical protein
VPTRRVWRYKPRAEPLTAGQWAFFLVRNKAGFDRVSDTIDSGEFFFLYYADHWREVYAAHCDEIDAEWNRRGWTQSQRKFVMTGYFQRGFHLAHDVAREKKMELWRRFEAAGQPGSFVDYLKLNQTYEENQLP